MLQKCLQSENVVVRYKSLRRKIIGGIMREKAIRITASCILSLCCLFTFGTISKSHNVYASYTRYVTANSLNVRKTASSSGKVAGSYKKGTQVTCYGTKGSWTQVKYGSSKYYAATSYLSATKPIISAGASSSTSTYTRYVTASSLNVRKSASSSASKLGSLSKGASVTCYGNSSGWTKIKYNGSYGYVSTSYLSTSKPSTVSKGQQVANYALQFRGLAYKWGGESLTSGVDCSGFTMKVYQHFGYYLPHSSISQRSYGTAVSWSNKQVGDLICYNAIDGVGHVGIYIGNNQVVHAGSSATGVHVSTANYRSVNCVRRIVK